MKDICVVTGGGGGMGLEAAKLIGRQGLHFFCCLARRELHGLSPDNRFELRGVCCGRNREAQ